MKIKEIAIDNFRCYKRQIFDLSADVVLIYGRNGTGKTAIFDAIEYALLGDIGRFTNEASEQDYLTCKLADGNLRIRVFFDDDEWVEVGKNNLIKAPLTINSSSGLRRRRDILYKIFVDKNYLMPRREVEPVKELFRSTLLLSQDNIRIFVEGTPIDRAKIFAALAGSAYMQRCLEKTNNIIRVCDDNKEEEYNKYNNFKKRIIELEGYILNKKDQLDQVKGLVGNRIISHDDFTQAITNANFSYPSIDKNDNKQIIYYIDSYCKVCDERIERYDKQINEYIELKVLGDDYIKVKNRCGILHENLFKNQNELMKIVGESNDLGGTINIDEAEIKRINYEIRTLTKRTNSLNKLPELMEQRNKVLNDMKNILNANNDIKLIAKNINNKINKFVADKNKLHNAIEKCKSVIRHYMDEIHFIENIEITLPEYLKQRSQISISLNSVKALQERKKEIEDTVNKMLKEMERLEKYIADLTLKKEQIETSSYDQRELLSKINTFVVDNMCPLCGHDHHSISNLQNAINSKINYIPKEMLDVSEKLKLGQSRLIDTKNKIKANQKVIENIQLQTIQQKENYNKYSWYVSKLEKDAITHKINLNSNDIKGLLNKYKSNLLIEENKLEKYQNIDRLLSDKISGEQNKSNQFNQIIDKNNIACSNMEKRINEIDQMLQRLNINTYKYLNDEIINDEYSKIHSKINVLEDQKEAIEKKVEVTKIKYLKDKEQVEKLKDIIKEDELSLNKERIYLENFERKAETLDITYLDLNVEIEGKIRVIESEMRKTNEAKDIIKRYKCQIELNEIERDISKLQNDLNENRECYDKSLKYFQDLTIAKVQAEEWVAPLTKSVSEAIETRIIKYQENIFGMFKAMIPYSFNIDDVKMKYEENGVEFSLSYKKYSDAGEPRFYLSCAQVNILALSIFLTLSTRQKWSRLNTVLLDDPVQHLDELDVVAFLDNLRAMALNKKQIIISTCDKKLYLLMMHKFSLLEASGIKLRAMSLLERGTEGPDVIYDYGNIEKRCNVI
jgi:exonuclease SbcC